MYEPNLSLGSVPFKIVPLCSDTPIPAPLPLLDRRTAVTRSPPYGGKRVTAVLRSIPKEAFADSFQKLYERCQPCVVKDDDYFEAQ
jgi:hypothetical protein